jgi:large subunit ribosomal protein L18
MIDKNTARLRRAKKARKKIRELGMLRLSAFRSGQHIYAQIFSVNGAEVLASASTLDKEVKAAGGQKANIASAIIVGQTIAKRAMEGGLKQVAFDRSGYQYHGCIKALADAARENGLEF